MRNKFLTHLILILLLCSFNGQSQDFDVEKIVINEGRQLTGNWAAAPIIKDHLGYIWVASSDGLNRYDGYEVKTYDVSLDDPRGIPSRSLTCIVQDHNHNLWIGTGLNGLIFYDYEKEEFSWFKTENIEPAKISLSQINDLIIDSNGDLWIIPPFDGPYKYSIKNNTLKSVEFKNDLNQKTINHYSGILLESGDLAFLLSFYLFIGNENDGFKAYKAPNGSYQNRSIYELPDHRLILGEYLLPDCLLFDPKTEKFTQTSASNEAYLTGFAPFNEDAVLIGTKQGALIYNFKNDSYKKINNPVGLIKGVSDSKGNIIYLSENGGMGKILCGDSPFESMDTDEYNRIVRLDENRFLGMGPGYVDILDYNFQVIDTLLELDDHYILTNIFVENDSTFILNAHKYEQTSGPDAYKKYEGEFYRYNFKGELKESRTKRRVYEYITKLKDGRILVNTEFSRIGKAADNVFSVISELIACDTEEGYFFLGKNIMVDSKEKIWVSTAEHGVIRLDENFNIEDKFFVDSDSCTTKPVSHYFIYESQSNEIYIFATTGILKYNSESSCFDLISSKQKIKNLDIKGITEDSSGNLWWITNDQITKYDPSLNAFSFFDLPSNHKLIHTHCYRLPLAHDGSIVLPTHNGIVKLNTNKLVSSQLDLDIDLSALTINNIRIKAQDSTEILKNTLRNSENINLTYQQKDIRIDFVSTEAALDQAQYYTYLDGYDKKWHLNLDRFVEYKNISPGSYTFKIQLRDKGNTLLHETKGLSIHISPPWYKSNLAYIVYGLLTLGFFYLIMQYRIRQIEKYQDLRTKISSDLHDDVGSILASVAMQSEILGLQADEDKKPKFEKLSQSTREAMSRMRDTVWAIDSRKDNVQSLVYRMMDFLSDSLEGQRFSYDFNFDESQFNTSIDPNIRQSLYLIFKESLTNAIKHSSGDTIKIELDIQRNNFFLKIHDNGTPDLSSMELASGLGLSNIKMRAEKIKATSQFITHDGFSVIIQSI